MNFFDILVLKMSSIIANYNIIVNNFSGTCLFPDGISHLKEVNPVGPVKSGETFTMVCDDGYVSSLSILTCKSDESLTAEPQCLISQGLISQGSLLLSILVTICFYSYFYAFHLRSPPPPFKV